MTEIKTFLITFIVVYFVYFVIIILNKKRKEKLKESIEAKYLINRFKLDLNSININTFGQIVALSNSFIISLTVSLVSLFNHFILKMLLGFIILIILELLIYNIIGSYLKRKERGNKNDV